MTDTQPPTKTAAEDALSTQLDDEQPAVAIDGDAAGGVPVEGDVEALLDEDVVVAEDAIDDVTMRRALEAILMVSDEPLPALALARTVGRAIADVQAALAGLAEEYTEQGRGFDLREVGGGWRYYTREDTAQYVERYVLDGQQSRLTQAALETLAVVAYKQPVSRARVSAIRGVNVDGVMRTLISRGLLEEAGPDTESQSTLYRTTSYFLERMGMQSLDDLPELAPYLPEMDDMEEELAAQAAAASGESAPAEEDTGPIENDLAPPAVAPEADDHDDDDEIVEADAASDEPFDDEDVADELADVDAADEGADGGGDDGVELSGDETDGGVARGETDESAERG